MFKQNNKTNNNKTRHSFSRGTSYPVATEINDDDHSYPLAETVALPCHSASIAEDDASTTITSEEYLKNQGYAKGLLEAIEHNNGSYPLRIWIVDNSGSMNVQDSQRLVEYQDGRFKLENCSRWAELQDTVKYHAEMAGLLNAPTSFRLLNPTLGVSRFGVAETGAENALEDLRVAKKNISSISPNGATPLVEHVYEITENVESMTNQLIANGQKVLVVVATDGIPTDSSGNATEETVDDFKNSLRLLQTLPVKVIIRLCTDDVRVVDFYKAIGSDLEQSIEVLDGFLAEARKIHRKKNRWLNYALPIHRIREMGFHHRLFELLVERRLTKHERREFVPLIYGANCISERGQKDFQCLLADVVGLSGKEKTVWNPNTHLFSALIDRDKLGPKYSKEARVFGFVCGLAVAALSLL